MFIQRALVWVSAGFAALLGPVGCSKRGAGYSPHVVVTPASGEGSGREFLVTVSPANDLEMAGLLVNSKPDGAPDGSNACYTLVNVTQGKFYLVKDPGAGSVAFTADSSAENSQCSVRVLSARRDAGKNLFEFRVAAQFKPTFGGGRSLFVAASDREGHNSLQQVGSWMVAP